MAHQKLLMDMPFAQAEQYLSKITVSYFSTLNTKIANQNMLKRILIAMHNKNEANCIENFRICAEEPIATSVQVVGINRPVEMEISQSYVLVLVHFGLIKTKAKIHEYFQHTSPVECTCIYSPYRSSSSQFGC